MSNEQTRMEHSSETGKKSPPFDEARHPVNGNYFPHLPAYSPPQAGIVGWMHPSIQPYLQIMRLDRLKPAVYFYLPHLVGSLQAATLLHVSPGNLAKANIHLLLGTFFLRGATCTWNDIADVEFDKRVERTRHRPLARGAISVRGATIFMLAQSVCAVGVLRLMPPACTLYALPGVVGWFLYPLAKRVTNYPQVVLGFPMAWGVFMGAAAVGAEPLRLNECSVALFRGMANPVMPLYASHAIMATYFANTLWTLCYETVYSYQDIRDDVRAGVKNIALLLGDRAKLFLAVVSAADIGLLFIAGEIMRCSWQYFICTVVVKTAALATKVASVDLSNPAECRWWFLEGGYITGGALVSGFALEYARCALL